MDIQNKVAIQIARYEKESGCQVKLCDLARAAGVSDDYIRKIVRGERVGSFQVLSAIAGFLGCIVDDLLIFAPIKKTKSIRIYKGNAKWDIN